VLKFASEEDGASAAVVLLLRSCGQDFEVLLVKRVENPTDFWSGQVALPGGRHEVQDENLKQTAIRETLEETGIDLNHNCRFLGLLEVSTSAGRRVEVLPFVFFLEREVLVMLNRSELEEYTWVELDNLIKHIGTAKFSFGEFPAFIIDNYVVWGLTYRILENFFQVLKSLGYPLFLR
jgi:8-oxo-dGTP pyrophosphatase MutT (NUDIX family)